MKIDVVVLWVTANDPKWQAERQKYLPETQKTEEKIDNDEELFRDWDTLKYLLRGINDHMPWVNNIFLVTADQRPLWLQETGKLKLIDHKDFLPAAYRPTFSSHAIELNLHRIPGLSEHFIYFNDDMLPAHSLKISDFFQHGLPADQASLFRVSQPLYDSIYGHVLLNNVALLNQHFSTKSLKKQPKFFSLRQGLKATAFSLPYLHYKNLPGFFNAHGPQPFLKSTFEKLWELEDEVLDATSRRKFRQIRDLNQYVFRDYQLLAGKWAPHNIVRRTRFFKDFPEKFPALQQTLRDKKVQIVCINDDVTKDFAASLVEMQQILENHYPNPSPWEEGDLYE